MTDTQFDTAIPVGTGPCTDRQVMEFHINARIRTRCSFEDGLFASSGNVIFANVKAVHLFVQKYNKTVDGQAHPEHYLKSGQVNAMGLIDEIFHYVCRLYRQTVKASFFAGMTESIEKTVGKKEFDAVLEAFTAEFPPMEVYRGRLAPRLWLAGADADGIPNRILALEELMLLRLANENPAFEPFHPLFADTLLAANSDYAKVWDAMRSWSVKNPPFGPEGFDLVGMLKAPVAYSPYDLKGQLDYIRTRWMSLLGDWLTRLLSGIDLIAEEQKAAWSGGVGGGNPDMDPYEFGDISKEYERFSPDREWMPNVVLMAKSVLVWLDQLTKKYGRPITRLDQIPDEELDFLAQSGFTGLWLIGLWERSPASARIKQICGNPEAAASAYSLDDYDIARELGGWEALNNLRTRAWHRGIRMASDMVPNHTGMDAKWVVEKPDLFVQTRESPFPGYDFNGENLSHDSRVGIYLENHYYTKSDCAVVFKRVDNQTGDTRYIYHGNDGTGMPWNDTAQIDFLNPQAREEVIQEILHVARNFPIIRFDAAMVLAKKHIQRLWYPEPGHGGDIASRSQHAISRDEFERRIPEEFWREVVDRCAKEIPDTLLLAEAFWMMEGYFVRTLGMHRVYNSAFMNMLKREDNAKYRSSIKNTIEFDPEILKRYVNFMNNPDEETAAVQFGNDDKYFGVCTMMVGMPGLPMFGHGQVEGFEEKYGMEYRRAYRDEKVNEGLVERHRREIFPLMKRRWLFAGVENFLLYDFYENGHVNENVFAWSNRAGNERALILYNNVYQQATGWIKTSAAYAEKHPDGSRTLNQRNLADGLALTNRADRYCIMQEQRSGLWYLRTTREIFDNGLFASLNGFQTQVFVNIYEADDNQWGHYRSLYESLGGRGIDDVHMGIQNIFLKDLYAALASIASADFFRGVRSFAEPAPGQSAAGSGSIPDFIKKLEKPAREFFAACERFIDGDYGARNIAGLDKKREAPTADTVWAHFALRLEKLLRIREVSAKVPAAFVPESVKVLANTAGTLLAQPNMSEVFAAAVLLYSLKDIAGGKSGGETALRLIDLWSLDRKMAAILAEYGMRDPSVADNLRKVKELLVLADIQAEAGSDHSGSVVRTLFTSEPTQNICGVHTWDHVSWFNKETAEHLVSLMISAAALTGIAGGMTAAKASFSLDDWNADLARLAKMHTRILEAFTQSGYQVEKLLAAFETDGGTTAKKAAKAPARKAGATEKKANPATAKPKTRKEKP